MQGRAPEGQGDGDWSGDRLLHQQWQGREVSFMRANEHSRERQGVWESAGLEGAALALVDGDRDNGRCALGGVSNAL